MAEPVPAGPDPAMLALRLQFTKVTSLAGWPSLVSHEERREEAEVEPGEGIPAAPPAFCGEDQPGGEVTSGGGREGGEHEGCEEEEEWTIPW